MTIIESREKMRKKYGKNGRTARLKFLITKILKKESGNFDFIIRELNDNGEPYSDVLKRETLRLLKNWKELKKQRNPKGGIENYSLE